jgi:hypothetical protein
MLKVGKAGWIKGEVSQSRGRQRCVLGIVLRRRLYNLTTLSQNR